MVKKYWCILFFFLLVTFSCSSQIIDTSIFAFQNKIIETTSADSTTYVVIKSIKLKGNNRTAIDFISSRINFKVGDSIKAYSVHETFHLSKQLLYNTNLFSEIKFEGALNTNKELSIEIYLKERVYVFIAPEFMLIDRNFNVWWNNFDADLNRAVYGVNFLHNNLTGNNDHLSISLTAGYSKKISVNYFTPAFKKNFNHGIALGFSYSALKEFNYQTSDSNKQLFYSTNNYEQKNFIFKSSYQIRKGFFRKHVFSFTLNHLEYPDSINSINSLLLNSTSTKLSFPEISYAYQYVNVDNVNFPLIGKKYSIELNKKGLKWNKEMNAFCLNISYQKINALPHQYFSQIGFFSSIKLPFEQSFINQKALGYGNYYLRGLEYYVIDGVASFLSTFTLKKKLIDFKIPLPFKIKNEKNIPFAFYGKGFVDFGYSYNKKELPTLLNNKLLYTGGLGIDLLTLYDIKLSIEYSINQLGEKGVFLHTNNIVQFK